MGDCNIIREDRECIGGQPRSLQAMEDSDQCNTCGLVETRTSRETISWCNGHEVENRKWAKLDRAMANINFINQFHSTSMEYLSKKTSDHRPMLIQLSKSINTHEPKPFRYQNMWSSHEKFLE